MTFACLQMSRGAFQKASYSHRQPLPTFHSKILSNGSKCMLILMSYAKMSKINLGTQVWGAVSDQELGSQADVALRKFSALSSAFVI